MSSTQAQWLDQVGSVLETLNQGVIINDEARRVVFAKRDVPRNDQNVCGGASRAVDRGFPSVGTCCQIAIAMQ